jgi:transcriptional regulator with XRE-family HTH domain
MKTENTPLLEARIAAGLTQKQLAVSLGIDQGHLSRIERNQCQPKPDLAALIVGQFKGVLDELMVIYPERFMLVPKKGSKK